LQGVRKAVRQVVRDATVFVRLPSLRPKWWPEPPTPPEVTQAIIAGTRPKPPLLDWQKFLAQLRTAVVPRRVTEAFEKFAKARAELVRLETGARREAEKMGLVAKADVSLRDLTCAALFAVPTTTVGVIFIPVGQPYDTVQEHVFEMFFWDAIDRTYF
jgi:hypothetical protein